MNLAHYRASRIGSLDGASFPIRPPRTHPRYTCEGPMAYPGRTQRSAVTKPSLSVTVLKPDRQRIASTVRYTG